MACDKMKQNMSACTCSYPGCSRKGKCCECISYHLKNDELPGCAFPAEVERTYDRSFARFVACHNK
jgi:hypothetical protein